MDPNNFFSEADFDISANIESALADISFSAIDIPADLNAFASQAQSKEYAHLYLVTAVFHFVEVFFLMTLTREDSLKATLT